MAASFDVYVVSLADFGQRPQAGPETAGKWDYLWTSDDKNCPTQELDTPGRHHLLRADIKSPNMFGNYLSHLRSTACSPSGNTLFLAE